MPRKVTTWWCEWGCGTYGSEDVIVAHEANCPYNPETLSCPTCKHFRDATIGGYAHCAVASRVLHTTGWVSHCPKHQPKDELKEGQYNAAT